MIHLLTAAAVITAAAITGLTYLVAGKVVPGRLPRSVLAGLAAAAALTIWVATVRHAALARSAAQPMSDGRKLSPGAILADGFAGMFIVATAAVFIISVVASAVRSRRADRLDSAPAGRRRRAAARGAGKA
jgi:hypothetical protein